MQVFKSLPFYTKLAKAVNFEDLAAWEEIKHLSLDNVLIEECGLIIRTKTTKMIKAERWREMTMCFVPQEDYSEIYNDPRKCCFVQIKAIQKDNIELETMISLNRKKRYHVDFIPNRIGFRAMIHTLETLTTTPMLLSFFENFSTENSKQVSLSNRCSLWANRFGKLEWFNKNIATNDEQQLAIRNIVNCTSYPLPYVVFGPPGE